MGDGRRNFEDRIGEGRVGREGKTESRGRKADVIGITGIWEGITKAAKKGIRSGLVYARNAYYSEPNAGLEASCNTRVFGLYCIR